MKVSRVDSNEVQIEKGVKIGSKQKAILGVIVVFAAIRTNMSCFENVEHRAP